MMGDGIVEWKDARAEGCGGRDIGWGWAHGLQGAVPRLPSLFCNRLPPFPKHEIHNLHRSSVNICLIPMPEDKPPYFYCSFMKLPASALCLTSHFL